MKSISYTPLANTSINNDIMSHITKYSYIHMFLILIGFSLIAYGIKIHFDIYDSDIIAVKATIMDIECNRHIINRRRDAYDCKINIRYEIDDRLLDNIIFTEGKQINYVGDEILVYVDRTNPVNVYTPYMSDSLLSLLLSVLGVLIILITLSARFLHVS